MANNTLELVDEKIAALLSDWSTLTTVLALALAVYFVYPIFSPSEPDTHPLLLARQSVPSLVRNKNESAIFRSPEVPHGYPLKSGLNVKQPGAARWGAGKDGDLRDIWREVLKGGTTGPDGKTIPMGSILTALGREAALEHDVTQLSNEMQIMGGDMKAAGCQRVAIYLPNSVEYLVALFACAFYDLTPILLPYNLPHPKAFELLNETSTDAVICAAGSLPLEDLARACTKVKLLTWVVEAASQHMDWNGVPEFAAERLTVNVWHDVVQDNQAKASGELPGDTETPRGNVIVVWQAQDPTVPPEIVTFTHGNIVAATGALVSTIPLRQRLTHADLFLPASSFHIPYVLCNTLGALFLHSTAAITSVAEPGVDLVLASRSVSPTVIVASAETMARLHAQELSYVVSPANNVGKFLQSQTFASGRMPTGGPLTTILGPSTFALGNEPGKLRLILTSERLGAATPPLTSSMLAELRLATRARICYALTTARVAGAVAQTHVFDYRREAGKGCSHFGVPLSSVELKLVGESDEKLGAAQPEGTLVVRGPAVSGAEVELGVQAKFREDGTLLLTRGGGVARK